MKARVFKKQDGTVIYDIPSSKYQESPESAPVPSKAVGLPSLVVEHSQLPESNEDNGNYHEMIYVDGELNLSNIKQDKAWDVVLMPRFLVQKKHRLRLDKKIDEELLKPSADPILLMQLNRDREKVKTEKEWYQQALANLDEDVSAGRPDKPIIRQKLTDKINSL